MCEPTETPVRPLHKSVLFCHPISVIPYNLFTLWFRTYGKDFLEFKLIFIFGLFRDMTSLFCIFPTWTGRTGG